MEVVENTKDNKFNINDIGIVKKLDLYAPLVFNGMLAVLVMTVSAIVFDSMGAGEDVARGFGRVCGILVMCFTWMAFKVIRDLFKK